MLILDIASQCHLGDISFSYHRRHGNQKELIERDIERRRQFIKRLSELLSHEKLTNILL